MCVRLAKEARRATQQLDARPRRGDETGWSRASRGGVMPVRSEIPRSDLVRMWGVRTWLLVAQSAVQGLQYAARPDRVLSSDAYALLRPLGTTGWRVLGVMLVLIAAAIAHAQTLRIRTPRWYRSAAFALAGAFFTFLFVAALLNHLYVAATLILPLGLCLSELDELNMLRTDRRNRARLAATAAVPPAPGAG